MIILRQKMYTSRATKELRKKILMDTGLIKKYESKVYRTVEKSSKEIEKEAAKIMKNIFGRGGEKTRPRDYRVTAEYRTLIPSNRAKALNEGISAKGLTKQQRGYYGDGFGKRTIRKRGGEDLELYDHGNRAHLVQHGNGARFWE